MAFGKLWFWLLGGRSLKLPLQADKTSFARLVLMPWSKIWRNQIAAIGRAKNGSKPGKNGTFLVPPGAGAQIMG